MFIPEIFLDEAVPNHVLEVRSWLGRLLVTTMGLLTVPTDWPQSETNITGHQICYPNSLCLTITQFAQT